MKHYLNFLFLLSAGMAVAQSTSVKAPDSVIIKVGKSRIILAIRDTADIRVLQQYDLEALVKDAVGRVSVSKDSVDREKEISVYLFNKKLATVKKGDLPAIDPEDLEKIQKQAEESAQQAQQFAEQELKWLRDQEKFIESESDLDREELKRIIKDRAERVKEKAKELSDRKSPLVDGFEFEFDSDDRIQKESDREHDKKKNKSTYQSTNFDFGTNNYLLGNKFPDEINAPYTVRPFGSWYVGVNNIYRTRIAKKLFIEWGLGVNAYNFKFQNDSLKLFKDDKSVNFISDSRELNYRKSKLVASFVQTSVVPVLDFGGNRRKPGLSDGAGAASFRIGAGPYLGYRIMSYSKQYFKDQGDKQRERNHDSFYLNNIRYGLRFQIGYRDTDVFFCYDLNELFTSGKGPALNAFSFGISF